MTAFEDFVNLELPKRATVLLSSELGFSGDPNTAVDAALNNAPAGRTLYWDQISLAGWEKTGPASTDWVRRSIGGGSLPAELWIDRNAGDDSNSGLAVGVPLLTDQAVYDVLLQRESSRNLSVEGVDLVVHDISPPGTYAITPSVVPSFEPGDQEIRWEAVPLVVHTGVTQSGEEVRPAAFDAHEDVTFSGAPAFSAATLDRQAFIRPQDPSALLQDSVCIESVQSPTVLRGISRGNPALTNLAVHDVVKPQVILESADGTVSVSFEGRGRIRHVDYELRPAAAAFPVAFVSYGDSRAEHFTARCVKDGWAAFQLGAGAQTVDEATITTISGSNNTIYQLTPYRPRGCLFVAEASIRKLFVEDTSGDSAVNFNRCAYYAFVGGNSGPVANRCARLNFVNFDLRNGGVLINDLPDAGGDTSLRISNVSVEDAGTEAGFTIENATGRIQAAKGTSGNTGAGVALGTRVAIVLQATPTLAGGTECTLGAAGAKTWAALAATRETDFAVATGVGVTAGP